MAGCCGGTSKRVTVEFEYLVVKGETCDRCGDSRAGVRAAVADALVMWPQLDVKLVERELASDHLADSNRVLVNGMPAEEWLGGTSAISSCESCSDLLSTPVCCREVEVGGVRAEAISRELVLDAIMAAAGLAPAGVPGENCCGQAASPTRPSSLPSQDSSQAGGPPAEAPSNLAEHAASCCGSPSRSLAVTVVTGPGCG